jgi:site-specific DNA-methyltransferase (cytosine-N4-specific)
MTAILSFHSYKYFPYEKVLARREAARLLGAGTLREHPDRIEVAGAAVDAQAIRLAYFALARHEGVAVETLQARLERAGTSARNRQATRYSVHGLHEYKGKFNPQIVKAILNIFDIGKGARVLDPFCGSGTTLVECSHIGANSIGFDLNPFAVFVANAKLQALGTPATELSKIASRLKNSLSRKNPRANKRTELDSRLEYLGNWFEPDNLAVIELVRSRIEEFAGALAPIFLTTASNLLRDYSLQDPNDLRIRRRKTPTPTTPFIEAFLHGVTTFIEKLGDTQLILGVQRTTAKAVLNDTTAANTLKKGLFDAAVTSPPYAMALPYIDTQRLSLVWLGLSLPSDIQKLEANLVGSRETRGTSRRELDMLLSANDSDLPAQEYRLCRQLASSLCPTDGFRRRAVPGLLYRYFKAMLASFQTVRERVKPGAPYALVVGHNHTILGGKRFDIDTPMHLASLAQSTGWLVDEMIPLQTYQRYGYHMDNAVASETLLLLRRP